MTANSQLRGATPLGPSLGAFLRDRRGRLQPAPGAPGRRRTPGLRREEVAARAAVSVTWYTWLEQGRGGPPSEEVLERLSRALELDRAGREVLFLLAQQRPPPLRAAAPTPPAPPAVQRVLDALVSSPAFVKTPTWDIVAWNPAALAVFGDYAGMSPRERNVLRRLFGDTRMREHLPDWEVVARFAVAVYRVDVARSGSSPEADALTAELLAVSPDFRRLWAGSDVASHGAGVKRLRHATFGLLTFDYASFAVEGAEGLSMVVYTPAGPAEEAAVQALIARTA